MKKQLISRSAVSAGVRAVGDGAPIAMFELIGSEFKKKEKKKKKEKEAKNPK